MTRVQWDVVLSVHLALSTNPPSAHAERGDSYADKIEAGKENAGEITRNHCREARRPTRPRKAQSILQGLQSLDERLVRYRQEHQDTVENSKKRMWKSSR